MRRRPPWFALLIRLRRFWPLLLIPAIRLVGSRLMGAPLAGGGRELAAALGIVGAGVWRWYTTAYATGERTVSAEQGILHRHGRMLPLRRLTVVVQERTPMLALCRGRRIGLYTADGRRGAGLTLYLPRENARRFWPPAVLPSRRRWWPALVLAASGSNAAVGLLTASVPIRQAARLWGDRGAGELVTLADKWLALGLPPVLKAVAMWLLAGWVVSFICNLLRYAGFSACVTPQELLLRGGLFTRRDIRLSRHSLVAVTLRQTLLMRLCGLYTVLAMPEGRTKAEEARPVLLPAAGCRESRQMLTSLWPDTGLKERVLRPGPAGMRQYWWAPFWWTAAGTWPLLGGRMWRPLVGLWLTFALWWLWIRLLGARRAAFAVRTDLLCLCYPRGLALYTAVIPRRGQEVLARRQSPWQRRKGTCDLQVKTAGGSWRIKGLLAAEVSALWTAEEKAGQ